MKNDHQGYFREFFPTTSPIPAQKQTANFFPKLWKRHLTIIATSSGILTGHLFPDGLGWVEPMLQQSDQYYYSKLMIHVRPTEEYLILIIKKPSSRQD